MPGLKRNQSYFTDVETTYRQKYEALFMGAINKLTLDLHLKVKILLCILKLIMCFHINTLCYN